MRPSINWEGQLSIREGVDQMAKKPWFSAKLVSLVRNPGSPAQAVELPYDGKFAPSRVKRLEDGQ